MQGPRVGELTKFSVGAVKPLYSFFLQRLASRSFYNVFASLWSYCGNVTTRGVHLFSGFFLTLITNKETDLKMPKKGAGGSTHLGVGWTAGVDAEERHLKNNTSILHKEGEEQKVGGEGAISTNKKKNVHNGEAQVFQFPQKYSNFILF